MADSISVRSSPQTRTVGQLASNPGAHPDPDSWPTRLQPGRPPRPGQLANSPPTRSATLTRAAVLGLSSRPSLCFRLEQQTPLSPIRAISRQLGARLRPWKAGLHHEWLNPSGGPPPDGPAIPGCRPLDLAPRQPTLHTGLASGPRYPRYPATPTEILHPPAFCGQPGHCGQLAAQRRILSYPRRKVDQGGRRPNLFHDQNQRGPKSRRRIREKHAQGRS
jgi:hypothetical protein